MEEAATHGGGVVVSAEREQPAPVERIVDAALERAARELRHAAYVLAGSKTDEGKTAARAALEAAAVAFALAKLKAALS